MAKAFADGNVHRFAYDPLGRLLKATTPEHELAFVHDPLGRVAEEHQAGSVVAHERDAAGRRIATTLPDGQRLAYAWNRFSRLEGVNLDGRPLSRHRWNEFAQEAERDQGDLTTRYAYDPAGRLVSQAASGNGDGPTLIGRDYRRDAAGHIAAIHDLRQGDSRYTYDPAGQLLDVHGVTPERFVHDPAGNLLGGGDARVEGDRLLMQGDRHFRYDAAGDLVEERRGTGGRLVTRYDYDASHRLVAAHTPQGTSHYRYDALGRRVAKTTSSGETRFFWDGATLLGEAEAGEARGVGEVVASTRWYVYEPGSFRPLACVQRGRRVSAVRLAARDGQSLTALPAHATEVFHYHLDHLGTPREMTDARGRIVWSARYRAWGALAVADVDEVDNPLRFQGQYHDAETGLYYNFQRYYDPRSGRFVTQDPIGLAGGENLYAYVSDPLTWVDPLGLAKRGPKTGGEGPHNETIAAWGKEVQENGGMVIAGGGVEKETLIPTPGGVKEGRRPDIIYRDADDNLVYGNVGKVKADNVTPVPRETDAMSDLRTKTTGENVPDDVKFRAYNKGSCGE